MNTVKKLTAGIVFGVLIFVAVQSFQGTDLSGTWIANFEIPNGGGMDEFTLVLKKAEESYKGTISDTMGYISKETPITNVDSAGNELSFSFTAMGGSLDVVMRLTAAGNKMTGQIEMQTENFPVEFVRKEGKDPEGT
jgi:hypothetical protein